MAKKTLTSHITRVMAIKQISIQIETGFEKKAAEFRKGGNEIYS